MAIATLVPENLEEPTWKVAEKSSLPIGGKIEPQRRRRNCLEFWNLAKKQLSKSRTMDKWQIAKIRIGMRLGDRNICHKENYQ